MTLFGRFMVAILLVFMGLLIIFFLTSLSQTKEKNFLWWFKEDTEILKKNYFRDTLVKEVIKMFDLEFNRNLLRNEFHEVFFK